MKNIQYAICNIYINKIVIFNKISFGKKGFKNFIGYKDGKKVRPLCILLPKMSAYRKDFDETKYISFLIKDVELLEKYEFFFIKKKQWYQKRNW